VWEKIRGVFLMPSNGKNATNFFPHLILGVIKKNPLFLHEIEWKNNGFLFTTPNIYIYIYTYIYIIINISGVFLSR